MTVVINGTTGITNDGGYTGDGVSFADTTPANTLVTTTGGNVGIGTSSPTVASGLGLVLNGGSGQTRLAFKNSYTGDASTDGIQFALENGSSSFLFQNREADGTFYWAINGTEQARITSAGLMQFNSGYGSSATAYGCRAWVNFNGTGTVAIRASGNVSSITDNGTGRYTVNFSTAMPDADYGANVSVSSMPAVSDANLVSTDIVGGSRSNPTTTAFSIGTFNAQFNDFDIAYIRVSVFR